MSIPSTPLPHFSGKNELSLQDLDALSKAVRAQGMTTELVPAAAHRGCRRYTGANYNLAQFADACTGEVATPDKPGLIASVDYDTADAPYIDSGNLVLPLAHDLDPAADSSEPTALVAGGLYRVDAVESIKRPQINRGAMQLPLAQSSWPQTAEGAMYTPGLVYAVQYDDAESCEGSVLPRIDQGIIHLPAPTSGGDDDACTGSCSCPLAQTGVPGLIGGIDLGNSLSPGIVDGVIFIPPAQWSGTGSYFKGGMGVVQSVIAGSEAQGLIYDGVIHTPWALSRVMPDPEFRANENGFHLLDLEGCDWCPATMSKCSLPDGTTLYLNAWLENGGLRLSLSTNSYYSY